MAPSNNQDLVEKRRKFKSKKIKFRKKWRIYRSDINYGPYLYRVLRKRHPNLSLSNNSINILNSFGNDMLDKIATEAKRLTEYNKYKTINCSEIQCAVRLVLPPALAQGATEFGISAVVKYYQAKKGINWRFPTEMSKGDKKEIWLKCFSTKKKMIYYWNGETQESFWEQESKELLRNPNVVIYDQTEDMRNGIVPVFCPDTEILATAQDDSTTMPQFNVLSKQDKNDDKGGDDDNPELNDLLSSYFSSVNSSSGNFSDAQDASSNYETSLDFRSRHSDPLLKSSSMEITLKKRRSLEIPGQKAPPPVTFARTAVKRFTNCGKRSFSDTSENSTSTLRSSGRSASPPKMAKLEIPKSHPRARHKITKTPIQDRKMKEREALLQKQKEKIVRGAQNQGLINNERKLTNFTIPKRKDVNLTQEGQSQEKCQHSSPLQTLTPEVPSRGGQVIQEVTRTKPLHPQRNEQPNTKSVRESQEQCQLPSPLQTSTPKVPLRGRQVIPEVTGMKTLYPQRNEQRNRNSGDGWIDKVWDLPPPVLVNKVITTPSLGISSAPVPFPQGMVGPQPRSENLVTPPSNGIGEASALTQFKNPSLILHPSLSQKFTGIKSIDDSSTTKLDSMGGKNTSSSPQNPSSFTFRRTLSGRYSSGENSTTADKGQNTSSSPSQYSSPFTFKRIVRGRNSAGGNSTQAETEKNTATSPSKNPSPFTFKRTVRGRNCSGENNTTADKVEEPNGRQFKDLSPELVLRTVQNKKAAEKNSCEESNKTSESDKNISNTGNETRKRMSSSDSDSESRNFKRTRSSSEIAFATSTPLASTNTTGPQSSALTRPGVGTNNQSSASVEQQSSPALGSSTFDARQVLEKRRSMAGEMSNKPSCSNEDDNAMEWEEIEPAEEVCCNHVTERLGAPKSSLIMKSLKYKPVVVVCDTNVLIHHIELVEELIGGSLLGIPVSVVLPYQVFRELDNIKENGHCSNVMAGARAAIRLINEIVTTNCPESEYKLVIQNSKLIRKKARSEIQLEKNDDLILNCALQEKDANGNDKIVILLTADKHLQIHAAVWKVMPHSPQTLKVWARAYKEKVRLQAMGMEVEDPESFNLNSLAKSNDGSQSEIKMDVDLDSLLASNSTVSLSTNCSQTEKSTGRVLNNCIFHAESLTYELSQFLICVINKCNERVFKDLKKHARQPHKNWTLVQCLSEVARRWSTITEKNLSPDMHSNIRRIIELVKKFNKAKEEFTNSDMSTYFACAQTLAKAFAKLYDDITANFLTRLNDNCEEWEQKCVSQSVCEEDDLQPADVALQNIYNCMRSDYETWKETVDKETNDKKKFEDRLRAFWNTVTSILRVINNALEEPQDSLTIDSHCIIDFLHKTTAFKAEDGNMLTFELTRENILALFREKNLRKGVVEILDKIHTLQCAVMDLLEELDSSDDFDI